MASETGMSCLEAMDVMGARHRGAKPSIPPVSFSSGRLGDGDKVFRRQPDSVIVCLFPDTETGFK